MFAHNVCQGNVIVRTAACLIAFAALAATDGGPAQAELTDGLLHYFPFDDGSGTTAANLVNTAYDGTLVDLGSTLPAWTRRGKVDGAVVFDGNGYIDLPDGLADFTGGITVSALVYHTSFPDWARIVDFGNGAGDNSIYLAHRGTSKDMRWEFRDTAGGTERLDANGMFIAFGWQHIVVTCDAAPANEATMRTYLNGDLAYEQGGKSVPANVVRTENFIGRSNWSSHDLFQGYIDELGIWNRPLDATEISDLHINYVLGTRPDVPEPSALILLTVAVGALVLGQRRTATRRRQRSRLCGTATRARRP